MKCIIVPQNLAGMHLLLVFQPPLKNLKEHCKAKLLVTVAGQTLCMTVSYVTSSGNGYNKTVKSECSYGVLNYHS